MPNVVHKIFLTGLSTKNYGTGHHTIVRVAFNKEAKRFHAKVLQASRDLWRVQMWMERQGFPPNDMLYRKTFVAASTLFDLVNVLHRKAFVGCRLGMNGGSNSPPKTKE